MTSLVLVSLVLTIDCPNNTIPIGDCSSFCRKKYLGALNFYNVATENCEPSPLCREEEEYDIEANKCFTRGEDELANITINSTNPDEDDGADSNNNELKPPKVNCVNGYYPSNSSLCVCYPGWITDGSSSNESETEITKCSIGTNYNSTNENKEEEIEVSTSNLSLILSIAIPSLIGVLLLIFIITCLKNKLGKAKPKLSSGNDNAYERPIVIHLSNEASEQMQIKDSDNLSTIRKLGYYTPPRTTSHQFPLDNCNYKRAENQNEELTHMKRLYTFQTPDKKQGMKRPPLTSITKQRTDNSRMIKTPQKQQKSSMMMPMSKLQFTNEDNDDNWNANDKFTLRNNYLKHQCYSNPHKKIKNVYNKPKISLTNIKPNCLPQLFVNSTDIRSPINPTIVDYRGDNVSDFGY